MTSPGLPLIGLSTYREDASWGVWSQRADILHHEYADSVVAAGGVPVLLPPATADQAAAAMASLPDINSLGMDSSCLVRKGYRKNIPAQKQRYEVLKEFAAEHTDEKGMTEMLEYLKFDFALHFNKSRHMVYSQVLDLGEGPVEYVFDYQKKNPLNAEAEYHVVK